MFYPIDTYIRKGAPPSTPARLRRLRGKGGGDAIPRMLADAGAVVDWVELTAEVMGKWIATLAPWAGWFTFTYDDDKAAKLQRRPKGVAPRVSEDWLGGQFRWWVNRVNRKLYNGRADFKDKWGHSLFSYVACFDYGDRFGRLHLHALMTGFPWHGSEAIPLWFDRMGYVKIEPVGDVVGRASYLAGYACKKRKGPDFLWIQQREWNIRSVTLS